MAVPCAACAAYSPLPLAQQPALAPDLAALRHDAVAIDQPLTINAVVSLVLQNDPALRAARAQHNVSQAQMLEAGLLPNPQFSGSFLPLLAGAGSTSAYTAGLTADIRALVTLRSRRREAQSAAARLDAQLLWQEWNEIGQARLLAIDLIEGAKLAAVLNRSRTLLEGRAQRQRAALAAGNATIATIAPDLAAAQAGAAAQRDLQLQLLRKRHALNALLGLQPDAAVPLAATGDLPSLDLAQARATLPSLAERRPDLAALRLGYQAQDEAVRGAILAQFPNLVLGIAGGSDNSNVRNLGPQLSLDLPIFDHNQGNIAIARATRQQLHDEYAARLSAAAGEAAAMLSEMQTQRAQLAAITADQAALDRDASRAVRARGLLDDRIWLDLATARLAKQQESLTLERSLLEQQIAFATLTGAGMPSIAAPTPAAPTL